VPESWPRLEPKTIAAFAGRPYAEVALEIIRCFAGDSIAEPELARMVRDAYGTFRHPAVAPLVQLERQYLHARAASRADARLQRPGDAAPRPADGSRAGGARRTPHHRVATSGDTGGAAVEAFRDCNQVDLVVLFPHNRISDVQRRMMTTAASANINAVAIDGTFDDCQAIVKGLFNHNAFRERVRLSGVNSINWARIVAQVVYYFTAAVALGAPARKVAFTVPTGNFGDIFAGYVAQRMGLPIERLMIATNVNDILSRTLATGTYELRDVVATTSPSMDIQVSSNFERLLFDAYGRDGSAVRALMGSLSQSRRFTLSANCLGGDPHPVHRRSRRRGRGFGDHPRHQARNRQSDRSAHRGRRCGCGKAAARSGSADGGAVDRASRQVSRCGRGRMRHAPGAPRLACRSRQTSGARHRAAG
jgi:threonine synthase